MAEKPHSAKKTKKQRKHGRWSRGGKATIQKLRIDHNRLRSAARYTKWLTKRRSRYGLPPSGSITAMRKRAYAAKCLLAYGPRPLHQGGSNG